jgi:hypothetical protein
MDCKLQANLVHRNDATREIMFFKKKKKDHNRDMEEESNLAFQKSAQQGDSLNLVSTVV